MGLIKYGIPLLPAIYSLSGQRALWRMPAEFANLRTGTHNQPEGDDWVAQGTFTWMRLNKALLPPGINDISYEHGLSKIHAEHVWGTQIDVAHFYFLGGLSAQTAGAGDANYALLTKAVQQSFNGGPKGEVSNWITKTRSGINGLLDAENSTGQTTVSRVIYAAGGTKNGPEPGLEVNWAEDLLLHGTVKSADGSKSVDFGTGSWNPNKINHNNHIHIDLNRAAIGEAPYPQ